MYRTWSSTKTEAREAPSRDDVGAPVAPWCWYVIIVMYFLALCFCINTKINFVCVFSVFTKIAYLSDHRLWKFTLLQYFLSFIISLLSLLLRMFINVYLKNTFCYFRITSKLNSKSWQKWITRISIISNWSYMIHCTFHIIFQFNDVTCMYICHWPTSFTFGEKYTRVIVHFIL